MSEPAVPTDQLSPEDEAIMAELRQDFAMRLCNDLAEVERELNAIRSGTSGAGYERIEELMHRDAGAGAVFGFDEASHLARNVEELVQNLGSDTSTAAQHQIAKAIAPLKEIALRAAGQSGRR